MVAILLAGQIASFAVLQVHVSNLEESSHDNVKRTEHMDLLRRTETLEKELVPRTEHMYRDAELNKRLDAIQENIKEVRDKVDAIDSRQRAK